MPRPTSWRCVLLLAGVATALPAQGPVSARLDGVVWDSLGARGLADARVRLVRADDPAVARTGSTDRDGRFAWDSLAGGVWLASFEHALLDSIGIDPPVVRIDVRQSGAVKAMLAVPSARTLVTTACGTMYGRLTLGMFYGRIRSARDDTPLDSAQLLVEWPDSAPPRRRAPAAPVSQVVPADSTGRFLLCGIPRPRTLAVTIMRGRDTSGTVSLALPPSGVLRRDLWLGGRPTSSATQRTRARHAGAARGSLVGADGEVPRAAVVRFLTTGEEVRPDSNGIFILTNVPLGTQTVEVRAIGYLPHREVIDVREAEPMVLDLTLPRVTRRLDSVLVRAARPIPRSVADFERRWAHGQGHFLTGDMVRSRTSQLVSDALRQLTGVRVVGRESAGQGILMRNAFGGECSAVLVVDGQQISSRGTRAALTGDFTIDDFVDRETVAAVEVYPRRGVVPFDFEDRDGCGVVAVWTKRAFAGRTPRAPGTAR